MINFKINEEKMTRFPHYWEMCVGSSHAYTALRADYRQQLLKAHRELGFKYVRFHGLFDDEMSVCTQLIGFDGKAQSIEYNFVNIDNIFDFLLKIDMKPFVELGFMPTCIASGKEQIFPYGGNKTMPKSDKQWIDLITSFIKHIINRYGIKEIESWFFEVWNEPNLPMFFAGSQADYFHLYEITAKAIKQVNSNLKVGGPATSFNSWIPEMIAFCESNNVPLDFLTTHHYPTDDPLWESGMDIDEYFKQNNGVDSKYPRGILKKMILKTKKQANHYPLYYTEWNVSAMLGDKIHDEPYASAMVAKTLVDNDGLVSGYSYWTFSDIFEEQYQKSGVFHGGFGMQTYQGIEKPVYRIFQIFHQLGSQRLEVNCSQDNTTVELLAVKKNNDLQLVAYNHNVVDQPITQQKIEINLLKPNLTTNVILQRIDEEHANAKKQWLEMGSPEYLDEKQIEQLRTKAQLQNEKLPIVNGKVTLEMLPYSCAYILIKDYFA